MNKDNVEVNLIFDDDYTQEEQLKNLEKAHEIFIEIAADYLNHIRKQNN